MAPAAAPCPQTAAVTCSLRLRPEPRLSVWIDSQRAQLRWKGSVAHTSLVRRSLHTSTHVSASLRCHPGQSAFPSPVGGQNFPLPAFPFASPTTSAKLKRWRAYTPTMPVCRLARHPPEKTSRIARALCPSAVPLDARPVPRAPLPCQGVTSSGVTSDL